MDYEKEILKLNLMGFEIKTIRAGVTGHCYSLVVDMDETWNMDPEFRATPFQSKEESIKNAVDNFLRFYKPMKKYGYLKN